MIMGAREKLRGCFPTLPEGESNSMIEAAVDLILNEHARELAEAIRADIAEPRSADMFYAGMRYAAHLIDQEAQS